MYVIDNTVLANFASINKIALLENILNKNTVIPFHVYEEFHNSQRFHGMILNHSFVQIEDNDLLLFSEVVKHFGFLGLGKGELACILTIQNLNKGEILLTDDKLARNYCKKFEIEVHGSIYILALGVKNNIFSLKEAENLLNEMKTKGFWIKEKFNVEKALKQSF